MKRIIVSVCVLLMFAGLAAEQIIKTAVVDLELILSEYKKDAKEVSDILKELDSIKTEEARIQKEILELKDKKLTAQQDKKDSDVLKYEKAISDKEQYIKEYSSTKKALVKDKLSSLYYSESFYKKMYDAIQYVAESNGFSLVLKKGDASLVIWNSFDIDITNDVIERLKTMK